MKNSLMKISLLTIFLLMFTLVGCQEEHQHKFENGKCECGEIHNCVFTDGFCDCGLLNEELRVEFFNKNLSNDKFITSSYNKKIEYNDTLLLEENVTNTFNDPVYIVETITKKLSSTGELEEKTTIEEVSEQNVISLEVKYEYFSELDLNENLLEGKIKDSASEMFLGIQANNVEIKIQLNDQLKVSSIELTYIDGETNFNVSIKISYNY